jgi:hypothetical protein
MTDASFEKGFQKHEFIGAFGRRLEGRDFLPRDRRQRNQQ